MLFGTPLYPAFLLVALAAYWAVPVHRRRGVLLFASLTLLTYLTWRGTAVFVGLSAYVYLLGRRLRQDPLPPRLRTFLLAASLLVPLAYLAIFKYLPEYFPPVQRLLGSFRAGGLLLPLGISFFTFKFVHYIIECRRRTLPEHTFEDFLCYVSLFSTFAAGPIERFGALQPQLQAPVFHADEFSRGMQRILVGMVKKIIIADFFIAWMLTEIGIVDGDPAGRSSRALYFYLWCRMLLVYADFSGYSDVAIGTSQLFGLKVMENFEWPLLRRNISQFWRSWHISLSSWCRDYVYFPVFGATRNPTLALFASMMVLGYWHGANPKWVCWGAWHASGLALWQFWQIQKRRRPALLRFTRQSQLYAVASWALMVNFVAIGEVWPETVGPLAAIRYLYQMFV